MYPQKRQKIRVVAKEVRFELTDNLMDHYYWRMFVHLTKFDVKVKLEDIMIKYKHNAKVLSPRTTKLIKSAMLNASGNKCT